HPEVAWVSAPIDAGFFMYDPPKGVYITSVVGLHGGEVVDAQIPGPDSEPVPSPFADLSRKTKEAEIETSVGRAVILSAPTKTDERCSWLQLGGHNVEVDPCFPPVYLAGGLRLRYARVGGAELLFGRVQARDSREGGIRVTFEDGSS